jgi:phospho-N-acetylmuramoyl-pentapeptide-transferase
MLINLVEWITENYGEFPGSGLFQYITFRAGFGIILSLIISMIFGGRIIRFLGRMQIGETVRDLGLHGQKEKEGTPTMGGVIIIMAILVPCLLIARLDNVYIIVMIVATTWMGIIGFLDDYIKVFRKNKEGLKGWFKILGQVGFGLLIGITMLTSDRMTVRMEVEDAEALGITAMVGDTIQVKDGDAVIEKGDYKTNMTNIPFVKGNNLDYSRFFPGFVTWLVPLGEKGRKAALWFFFLLLVVVTVTAVSNAANLTDGLDGLATGVSGIIGVTLGIFAYVSGNAIAANYLSILHLPGTEELVIFSACFIGASLGFLWYNAFPAQIFMGDTGSLTLGGITAAMAILLRKELLIPILCGIFLVESLSVIMQVSYFKYTKRKYGEGRRIFRMSPLHHHYQKKGMSEVKIVIRFWIVGILLAVFTIITLKIR